MSPSQQIQGVEARYALYALDAHACSEIKRIWPTIAPHLEKAVDDIIQASVKMPAMSKLFAQHRDLIKSLEMSHLQALLSGELDDRYMESCRKTVEQETALGDSRC